MSTINNLLAQHFKTALDQQINDRNGNFFEIVDHTLNSPDFQKAYRHAEALQQALGETTPVHVAAKKTATAKRQALTASAKAPLLDEDGVELPKRPRGRPAGSKNKPKSDPASSKKVTKPIEQVEESEETDDGPYIGEEDNDLDEVVSVTDEEEA